MFRTVVSDRWGPDSVGGTRSKTSAPSGRFLFTQFFAKGAGAVGGDGLSAVADEAAGGFGIVDGPDVVRVAGTTEAIDELFVYGAMGVGGEAVGSGGFEQGEGFVGGGRKAPALAVVGDDEAGVAIGAGFFPGSDEVGIEGDNDDLVGLEAARGESFFKRSDHFGSGFDLDEDFLLLGNGGEDLCESGDAGAGEFLALPAADIKGLQLSEGGLGDGELFAGDFLGVFVVNADNVAVFGKLKVAFNGVGSLLPSEFECGQGVLGGIGRSSAVGDDEEGDDEFDHDVGARVDWVLGKKMEIFVTS